MDRIMSARMDEGVVALLDALSRKTGKSKKRILEEALRGYAERPDGGAAIDVLEETCGAWKRQESAAATASRTRAAFRSSLDRGAG